jgi:hypothetical protein
MPIQIDESTITGNIDIMRNILRDQLGALDGGFFETGPAILGHMTGLTTLFLCQACFTPRCNVVEAIIKAHWGEEAKEGLKAAHYELCWKDGKEVHRPRKPGLHPRAYDH